MSIVRTTTTQKCAAGGASGLLRLIVDRIEASHQFCAFQGDPRPAVVSPMRFHALVLAAALFTPGAHAQSAGDLLRAIAEGVDKKEGRSTKRPAKKKPATKERVKQPTKTEPIEEATTTPEQAAPEPTETAASLRDGEPRLPRGHTRKVDVVVRKGDRKQLAGSTTDDESIVGSCYDENFILIDERLAGASKSRDVDESHIGYTKIATTQEKQLNAKLLSFFNVSIGTMESSKFLVVSHTTTTRKWKLTDPNAVRTAAPHAAYCAVEASEGRTIDALYTASASADLASMEAKLSKKDAVGAKLVNESERLGYQLKVRGYKSSKASLPDYNSFDAVLAHVEPGATFISEIILVATRDIEDRYVEVAESKELQAVVVDNGSTSIQLTQAGTLEFKIVSSAPIVVRFRDAPTCKPTVESTIHSFSCEFAKPPIMELRNPALLGLGADASVKATIRSVSRVED